MFAEKILCVLLALFLGVISVSAASSDKVLSRAVTKRLPSSPKFLILPGFGNDQLDYVNPLKMGEEVGFVSNLDKRGYFAEVLPIRRFEWLKLLGGAARDPSGFQSYDMTPKVFYQFYLDRIESTITKMINEDEDESDIILLCHSAGGWLGRAFLGENSLSEDKQSRIKGLVTMGSPHYSPKDRTKDATRGSIRYVEEKYSASALQQENSLFIISIAGTAVSSDLAAERGSREFYANDAYLAVTGESIDARKGDGVVPLDIALLDGAKQITLKGVYHSIQAPDNAWYGGDSVIDMWLPAVLAQYKKVQTKKGGSLDLTSLELAPVMKNLLGEKGLKAGAVTIGIVPYILFFFKFVANANQ